LNRRRPAGSGAAPTAAEGLLRHESAFRTLRDAFSRAPTPSAPCGRPFRGGDRPSAPCGSPFRSTNPLPHAAGGLFAAPTPLPHPAGALAAPKTRVRTLREASPPTVRRRTTGLPCAWARYRGADRRWGGLW